MIRIAAESFNVEKNKFDLLLIPVFKGEEKKIFTGKSFGKTLLKKLQDEAKRISSGRETKLKLIDIPSSSKKIILVGLGSKKDSNNFLLKETFGGLVKYFHGVGFFKIGLFYSKYLDSIDYIESAIEGIGLASYRFDKYKSSPKAKDLEIIICVDDKKLEKKAKKYKYGIQCYLDAVCKLRDTVNEPSNVLTPSELERRCLKIGKNKNVKVKVLKEKELKSLGMNLLCAVGRGSKTGSMLVCLHYKPRGAKRKIAFAGKGITFDTGGYSLKPPQSMLTMKGDMLGAAVVMSAVETASVLNSKTEIIGLVPIAENLVNEEAFKPDDVIKASNGKTVEIESTDAEGRLILADSLNYALKFKPDEILDVGTIAGACLLSLGELVAPYVSNSEKIAKRFSNASKDIGEVFVRLPYMKEYSRFLKSEVADMKNASFGVGGGLLSSALFLSEFVNNKPWMHIDLAGVDNQKGSSPIYPKGSSGFGLKTIFKFLDIL